MCRTLASTCYIPSFRNAINQGAGTHFDIPTGQALIQQWDSLKRGDNIDSRQTTRNITSTLAKIFGFNNLEVNASVDRTTLIIDADEESFTLNELGAGFSQFFMVLVGVGFSKPDFVLIDEPELSLHPSLQLAFLSTLESFAQHGVIFSTHSPGLARSTAQRMYSVRRESKSSSTVVVYEATPDLPEFLGELSFSGYQELGFDCVLLVEGITEVKTFHQFLRLYGKDQKVLVMPMGGSDLINDKRKEELADLKRITSNIHAVIDSERNCACASIDRARSGFVDICERLEIDCHVLERRAIENYFPQHAIDRALGSGRSALLPYDKLPGGKGGGWSKNDNWRIAHEMRKEDLEPSDLGDFLKDLA